MYYLSLNQYLRDTFGEKLYKLSLHGGMTCPNRDGTCGDQGCIFCSAGGSGDFATAAGDSVTEQIALAKRRVSQKFRGKGYIAYFQAFTNTYGPVTYLEQIFMEAITHPEVRVLSIATRPDCLGDDVLALLSTLNQIKPVWVELGLQTIHQETAEYIRRGYNLKVYDQAVKKLRAVGVEVITHLILGLPGETVQDMLASVDYVAHQDIQGVKLQLLHVLKGTDLADDYQKGYFHTMSLEEYIRLLGQCIEHLKQDIVVHRLTGDGPKNILLAPEWSKDKKNVLNAINKYFREQDICQGRLFSFPVR